MSNGTRFYKTWGGMLYRSRNKQRWYTDINVCERWEKFEYFMEDLLPSYEEHVKQFGIDDTTIDRINPFGNYEPGNVRWATRKQQANNRRQSRSKDGVKISSSSND